MALAHSMPDDHCGSQLLSVLPPLPQWAFCSSIVPLASDGASPTGAVVYVLSSRAFLIFAACRETGNPRWNVSLPCDRPGLSLPVRLQCHPAATDQMGGLWRDRGIGHH